MLGNVTIHILFICILYSAEKLVFKQSDELELELERTKQQPFFFASENAKLYIFINCIDLH